MTSILLATLLALLVGYLLGSIPTAAWLARLRGASIFEVGSGNMGAMNTARNLGLALGIAVLVIDAGKGALATVLGSLLGSALAPASAASGPGHVLLLPPLAAGLGAVLGHGFSLYAGFRGGKGLAAAAGAALPLYPVGALVTAALLIVLTLLLRPRTGLAAVITVSLYPFLVVGILVWSGASTARALTIGAGVAALAVVVLGKHALAFRRERRPGP